MSGVRTKPRIAKASEYPKFGKVRRLVKKFFTGREQGEIRFGHAVDKISGCGKGEGPKC